MRRMYISVLFCLGIFAALLSSCVPATTNDPAARVMEGYLTALVDKDSNRLAALSCATWETDALIELDSFQAVETHVDGLACQTTGTDSGTTLVTCQGKIVATYNNEDQELDLSVRTYQVVQEGGEYLVCGYR